MQTTADLLEASRSLWDLVMNRPEVREAHAAYVGTTEFLTIGDPAKKIQAQIRAIEAGPTLSDAERELVTKIHARIASLSQP